MMVALDYDGTYTLAPALWDQVIQLLQGSGHTVVCITSRMVADQELLDSIGKLVPVVFAGSDWKNDAAKKSGYQIDVWIDDIPTSIMHTFILGGNG